MTNYAVRARSRETHGVLVWLLGTLPLLCIGLFWVLIIHARWVLGAWPARVNGDSGVLFGGGLFLYNGVLCTTILVMPLYVGVLLYQCLRPMPFGRRPVLPLLVAVSGAVAFIWFFSTDPGGYLAWLCD